MTELVVLTKKILQRYGLLYFRADMKKGGTLDVKSDLDYVSIGEYCAVIAHGAIDIFHPDKEPAHRTWTAAPTMIAQGIAIPGRYVLTAMEDSVYVCCSPFFTDKGPWIENNMYKVNHIHLKVDETYTFKVADNIEALVILDGNVEVLGTEGNQGPGSVIKVEHTVTVKALIPTHITMVCLK